MAIPFEFAYEKPATIADALHLLDKWGSNARILAGGTDLANELKQGFRVPELLVDIKGLNALEKIKVLDDALHIGALATFDMVRNSQPVRDHVYILYEVAGLVASSGVRNRATVVGNICSAVACMDSAAPLLVHDAVVHTASLEGEREVPVQDWFVDNRKTLVGEKEMVSHVSIPLPKIKYAGAYQKMMRYTGEDLAAANVGVLLMEDGACRVAFGSVGPIPRRSPEIESFLEKNGVNARNIEQAKEMIGGIISPITDVRATREYRMHMTKVMFVRAMHAAVERLEKQKR